MPTASTSCLVDGLAMSSCSHIMDTIASAKVHGLRDDLVRELTYLRVMDERPPHYLRQWRKKAEMTQQDLADALDTSKSVISALERFELQLSPKWLRRIAPVLKTREGYLIDVDPAEAPNDVIDIWNHIPLDDRDQALRVLRSFVKTGTND